MDRRKINTIKFFEKKKYKKLLYINKILTIIKLLDKKHNFNFLNVID